MLALPASAAQCYITKNVCGHWIEYWFGSSVPSGVISYKFEKNYDENVTNLTANGHAHTGTLTTFNNIDPGNKHKQAAYDSTFGYWFYDWFEASATYYGYQTCK